MGFYIEELPTELNGITMQEADYLADEFLKDEPCNRMWDAMRALRDFYETVISEVVEVKSTADTPQTDSHITCYGICTDKCGAYENGDCILNAKKADTPQTDYPCNTCANKGDHDGECKNCVADSAPIRWKTPSHYKPKQTDCPWK